MTDPQWWNPAAAAPAPPRRRRRGWITLLVVLGLLALVAVAVDRGAAALAERALGRGVQREQGLPRPGDVSIAGFPFLTQALAGRYRQIDLAAEAVPTSTGGTGTGGTGGTRTGATRLVVDRITVRLSDVSAGAADVVAGRADRLRAGRVAVRAQLGYLVLNALVAERLGSDQLTVRFSDGGGNQLAITGTIRTQLGALSVGGRVQVTASKQGIRLSLVPGSVESLPPAVTRALVDLLDLTLAAPEQLSGIRLTGIEVAAGGLVLVATGIDVPLGELAS